MELSEARVMIDKIDDEIKNLFLKRMEIIEDIARIKAKTGDMIYKPEREAEVILRLSSDVDDRYREGYIEIVKQILLASRNYQFEIIDGLRKED